jgi:hypothetical protein
MLPLLLDVGYNAPSGGDPDVIGEHNNIGLGPEKVFEAIVKKLRLSTAHCRS